MQDELRTKQQNRALHLWFKHIAEMLNDAGFEKQLTVGTIDVPWSMETVKILFKKIGKAQVNEWHTSEMTREQLNQVQETMHRFLSEQGIQVPFPSLEELSFQLKALEEKTNE